MTIACKICHFQIQSAKPDQQAQADVMKRMAMHLRGVHHDHHRELEDLLKMFLTLTTTHLVFGYVDTTEPALLASYAANKAELMNILESYPEIEEPAPTPAPAGPVN